MVIAKKTARTAFRTTALAFSAALLVAACSSGGGGGGKASDSTGAAKAGSGTKVTVTETEFALKLSRSSFTPGTYTFTADNAGTTTHALELDGPGVSDVRTKNISSGQNTSVTVMLKKGTYELYCPVDGHRQLGMKTDVKVG
ncbi:plastocyanin/azurin family copper-binding protein [Streptomyces sp. NPDC048324]|uniref:plastocyanin/azurin family copper-binding protein n=1 Tax=Streptomyces sp. NPDC048324 TaxID=3157205 RepID=UPI003434BDD3